MLNVFRFFADPLYDDLGVVLVYAYSITEIGWIHNGVPISRRERPPYLPTK
tara:strand:+ start:3411 stop:3563 length:153 start_codon:yes stop_codon:yes gene_type:complete